MVCPRPRTGTPSPSHTSPTGFNVIRSLYSELQRFDDSDYLICYPHCSLLSLFVLLSALSRRRTAAAALNKEHIQDIYGEMVSCIVAT